LVLIDTLEERTDSIINHVFSRRPSAKSGEADTSGWPLLAAALEGAIARLIIDALEAPSAAKGLIDGATPEKC
jgi:hypothetical protein